MLANGRSEARPGVGTAEQIAAMQVLVEFADSESHLAHAAGAALHEMESANEKGGAEGVNARIASALNDAIFRLDEQEHRRSNPKHPNLVARIRSRLPGGS